MGTKQFIGYVLVFKSSGLPASGTRRFKVWTTEKEAGQRHVDKYPELYAIAKVYAEVEPVGKAD